MHMKSEFDALFERLAESYIRIGQPKRILAAFSGGADSTALLILLSRLRAETGLYLAAAHINHGLRQSAERDELFCRDTSESLGIPFTAVRLQLTASDEESARIGRYGALYSIAAAEGCQTIALAHHMNDQAETLLMRLMRGSVDGLGGMKEKNTVSCGEKESVLWRPLLRENPETLKQALLAMHQGWMMDETNQDDSYLRNFLRLRILPEMEKRQPGTAARIAGTAEILREESDFMNACARSYLHGHAHLGKYCPFIEAQAVDQSPIAVRRRMIRLFLRAHDIHPDSALLASASTMQPGESLNLPGNGRLKKSRRYLHLVTRAEKPVLLPLQHAGFQGTGDGKRTQAFPEAVLAGTELRYRQPGDRIIPFGMHCEKSLQDYLVDRKIEEPFRDYLPMLCCGRQVLWVIGVGCSESCRVSEDEKAVRMAYAGFLPGLADYRNE